MLFVVHKVLAVNFVNDAGLGWHVRGVVIVFIDDHQLRLQRGLGRRGSLDVALILQIEVPRQRLLLKVDLLASFARRAIGRRRRGCFLGGCESG